MTTDTTPALSIVATTRNDDHGGGMLKRTQLFVRCLLAQCRRHRLQAELVLVEWNPPDDRPPLCDVLPSPGADDTLSIRYVVVPQAIHARYRHGRAIPLFQMIAKNVGIRRARADFILCTNVDLLFSDAVMQRLSSEALRPECFYRCNRCDVPETIDETLSTAELLLWCAQHVIRRQGRDMRYPNINVEALGLKDKRVPGWLLDKAGLVLRQFWSPAERAFYELDSFACGDFTMMHRDAWHAVRGYLELDLYSLHVDSLGLVSAKALGYTQHVYPREACTYHIDHASGWSSMSAPEKLRFVEERPAIDYSLLREVALYALEHADPLHLNDDHWGLADVDLEEIACPTFRPDESRFAAGSMAVSR